MAARVYTKAHRIKILAHRIVKVILKEELSFADVDLVIAEVRTELTQQRITPKSK